MRCFVVMLFWCHIPSSSKYNSESQSLLCLMLVFLFCRDADTFTEEIAALN